MNTVAVWPLSTGTRMHCEVMRSGPSNGTISPLASSTWPKTFSGSFSDFASSPEMNGMMLPTISGQSLNVLPAPEMAWYVLTMTSCGSNSFHAAKAGV